MTSVKIFIPGPPVGKARPRLGGGRVWTPEQTRAYETQIALETRSQMRGQPPHEGACHVTVIAYYPIPKRFTQAAKLKAEAGEILPVRTPDGDNILKAVCDGLEKGGFYLNDKQVVQMGFSRVYGGGGGVLVGGGPLTLGDCRVVTGRARARLHGFMEAA